MHPSIKIHKIKFKPEGFAEVMDQAAGLVQSEAEAIAQRATSALTEGGSGFHVEMDHGPQFQDAAHGVSRPFARIVSNDDESAKQEWTDHVLSRAVR